MVELKPVMEEVEVEKVKQIDQKIIVCETALCTGCRICEYACSIVNDKVQNPRLSRIKVIRIDPTFDLAVSCRKCDNARCIEACAVNAIFQNAETKSILINEEKCVGCGFCIDICNFGVMSMSMDKKLSLVCDNCEASKYAEEHDGVPACVDYCPKEALKLVSIANIELPEVKAFHMAFQSNTDKPQV